jgi:hypothetical protein
MESMSAARTIMPGILELFAGKANTRPMPHVDLQKLRKLGFYDDWEPSSLRREEKFTGR